MTSAFVRRALTVVVVLLGIPSAGRAQSDSALVVKSGGNSLLRVDKSGNVGLGTATPTARLEVDSGGVAFRGNDGFLVTGTMGGNNNPGPGAIPASGAGARLMWYGAKGAFRAGYAAGSVWDDGNIGNYSFAAGTGTIASGATSMAFGSNSVATGSAAIALGVGANSSATGSVAIGWSTTASGDYSVALGRSASTNSKAGSFVFGDNSSVPIFLAPAANTFSVRAAGGIWLGTDNTVSLTSGAFISTGTGAYLSSGGTWTNSSDVHRKHLFADVAGDQVLARLRTVPVRSWSYRAESDSVRHLGPTAQDFRRAFALGNDSTSIATIDADGVSLAGVQALDARTMRQQATIDSLRAENVARDARIRTLEVERETARHDAAALAARVARLEALLKPEQ